MAIVKNTFLNVLKIIPSFDITNPEILPYGLKPHTRSVAWIVEQVITQQTRYHKQVLGLTKVDNEMSDTCLHDCILYKDDIRYFVNIKIHNIAGKANKNDIAAVEKLYMQYRANNDYRLIYCCFGFSFENTTIHFDKEAVHVFSPQFLPIYVNPRNDKIQSQYHHREVLRSREDFLGLLKIHSKSIILN